MRDAIRQLLSRAGELGASADAIVVILALLALADEQGRARVYATEIGALARLSKRRTLAALVELPALSVEVEGGGKKGAKTVYDVSSWLDREGSERSFSTRESPARSFSEKDHSDPSRREKARRDPSRRKITSILLDADKGAEKDHVDPSRQETRKPTSILLDAEKDHVELSSRARDRARAHTPPPPPLLVKEEEGPRAPRASRSPSKRAELDGLKGRRTESAAKASEARGTGATAYGRKESLSAQDRAVLARAEEEDLERELRREEVARNFAREDLPLDVWLEACFSLYGRAISTNGLTGLAHNLLATLKNGANVRAFVNERFLKHEAGARVSDQEFVKFLLRDAPEWQIAASQGVKLEALPRLEPINTTTNDKPGDLSEYITASKIRP